VNVGDAREAELDARLRRLHGELDAAPGFEGRVMKRIAGLGGESKREDLRTQFEYRRELLRHRLRRETWMNGITTLGIGACAFGLLWRYARDFQHFATGSNALNDPNLLIGGTIVFLAGTIWFVLRRGNK
jgi:hypothetical protein